jgi:hypothetical protein
MQTAKHWTIPLHLTSPLNLLPLPPAAGALQQVQAIWSLRGVCSTQPDTTITRIIGEVVNALTNVPWGSQQQSANFGTLCKKTGILTCQGVASASSVYTPRTLRRLQQQDTSSQTDEAPGQQEQASPPPQGQASPVAQDQTPASCANSYWYLYL